MKKSIKNIIALVLMVPVLALGISIMSPSTSLAVTTITGPGDLRCKEVKGLSIEDAAACNNKAGGTSCLFGKYQATDGATKDCVLNTVINVALYFIGSISVLMLIIGGVRYTMSGGNDKAVGAAKNTILYAVIGVVVALLAYAIVNFVLTTFTA